MQTKSLPQTRQLPSYPIRILLGLLVLTLTLVLLVTAVGSFADSLMIEERCESVDFTTTDFTAETAVPDCWLVQ